LNAPAACGDFPGTDFCGPWYWLNGSDGPYDYTTVPWIQNEYADASGYPPSPWGVNDHCSTAIPRDGDHHGENPGCSPLSDALVKRMNVTTCTGHGHHRVCTSNDLYALNPNSGPPTVPASANGNIFGTALDRVTLCYRDGANFAVPAGLPGGKITLQGNVWFGNEAVPGSWHEWKVSFRNVNTGTGTADVCISNSGNYSNNTMYTDIQALIYWRAIWTP
jgi:hypothetical protein